MDSANVMNPNAYVNAANFQSLQLFVEEVNRLSQNEEELQRMASEPLFSYLPDLADVSKALRRLILSN
jgi:hypothetical protein